MLIQFNPVRAVEQHAGVLKATKLIGAMLNLVVLPLLREFNDLWHQFNDPGSIQFKHRCFS